MIEPKWVLDEVVRSVHRRQIAEHGGIEGIRDVGMLASALSKPKNLFLYSDPKANIAAMAASYAYGIANNHPFIDGNKRTAFVVCRLFLKLNGADLYVSQAEKFDIFLKLAAGKISEEELGVWINEYPEKQAEITQ